MTEFKATKRENRTKNMTWKVTFEELIIWDGKYETVRAIGFGATKKEAISDCMRMIALRVKHTLLKK